MNTKFQVIKVPVNDIISDKRAIPAEAVAYAKESIWKYGFRQPIIIDGENAVLLGQARLLAAQELGMMEAPCIRLEGLIPEEIEAYRIADTKISEISTWDWDRLKQELAPVDKDLLA